MKTKSQLAFTIIEVLVVISIMAILMIISIPNFHQFSRNAKVRNSAKALRSFFWEAQSFALAPKEADVDKYEIFLSKGWGNENKIEIKDNYGEVVSDMVLERDVVIEDIILISEGVPSESLNSVTVSFKTGNIEGGKIVFSPEGTELIIRVGSVVSALKYDIVLNGLTDRISLERAS